MFIKLLIISQLLALALAQLSLEEAKKLIDDASVYSDEQTGDDMHQPEPHYPPQYKPQYEPHYHHGHKTTTTTSTTTPEPETTTEPPLETANNATVAPDGLGQLDDGLGQVVSGTALPESTTTPEPETTTTTPEPETTTTKTTPKPHKHDPHPYFHSQLQPHPQSYPHPQPYPHPYPYPYPHPVPYPQHQAHPYGQPSMLFPVTGPKPASESESSSSNHGAGHQMPGVSNQFYPRVRYPYSPFKPPLFHGYTGTHLRYPEQHKHEEESTDDQPKEDEDDEDEKEKEKEKEPEQEHEQESDEAPYRPPSYGYPSAFLVPRRPLIPVPSYPRSGGGYGSSYGYGRY